MKRFLVSFVLIVSCLLLSSACTSEKTDSDLPEKVILYYDNNLKDDANGTTVKKSAKSFFILMAVALPDFSKASYTWTCSNPNVTQIEPGHGAATIKCLSKGVSQIFVTTQNGIKASIVVDVCY